MIIRLWWSWLVLLRLSAWDFEGYGDRLKFEGGWERPPFGDPDKLRHCDTAGRGPIYPDRGHQALRSLPLASF
jgi:hypothetical protein